MSARARYQPWFGLTYDEKCCAAGMSVEDFHDLRLRCLLAGATWPVGLPDIVHPEAWRPGRVYHMPFRGDVR